MNKKQKQGLKELFSIFVGFAWLIIFMCGITLIFTGTIHFMTGYHNFDSGHNWKWVNEATNSNFVDYHNTTDYYTPQNQISIGSDQLFLGLKSIIVGCIISGFTAAIFFIETIHVVGESL